MINTIAIVRPPRKLIAFALMALLLSGSFSNYALAAPGDLDPFFGSGGKVVVSNGFAWDVAVQPDGRIVVAASTFNEDTNNLDFAPTRFNSDGNLDNTFGSGGRVTTDFFGGSDEAHAVVIQPDGKIIIAGQSFNGANDFDFSLARYNADGSLDSSFGSGGKATADFSGLEDHGFALGLQADGKIVMAGYTVDRTANKTSFALARFNADGGPDSSFGSEGRVTTSFSGGVAGLISEAFALSIQPDGKIIAGGVASLSNSSSSHFALARYNGDGSLDSSFGSEGKVVTPIGIASMILDLALQPDGKIVAAGGAVVAGTIIDFALARYNTGGGLDPAFGSSGKVTTDFFHSEDEARGIVIQPDGKIAAGGKVVHDPLQDDFGIARYNADGSLDPSFGGGGKTSTDFFGRSDVALGLALQPDGKILAAGRADLDASHGGLALARYNGDGEPPVSSFDMCLQDDGNGNMLQFNSSTGDYQFTNCRKGITLSGRGNIRVRSCKIELRDGGPDRSLSVVANTCTKASSASVQLLLTGKSYSVSDKNMSDNTCACK